MEKKLEPPKEPIDELTSIEKCILFFAIYGIMFLFSMTQVFNPFAISSKVYATFFAVISVILLGLILRKF